MKRSAALASLLESYKLKKKIRTITNLEVAERSKKQSSPVSKPKQKKLISLPEKYESLIEFFGSMETSIRLFRMRQRMTNFTDIKPSVECLNKRRFSYANLAQLKYILPEKIVLKKVIIQKDKRTEFREYDLNINLQNFVPGKGFSSLKEEFRSRLMDFLKSHPKSLYIKRMIFHRASYSGVPPTNRSLFSTLMKPGENENSFSKHVDVVEGTPAKVVSPPWRLMPGTPDSSMRKTDTTHQDDDSVASPRLRRPPTNRSLFFGTPMKPEENDISLPKYVDVVDGTTAKVNSTPSRLMPGTPDLSKRKTATIHQDDDSIDSLNKLHRCPGRSLLFSSTVKNATAKERSNEEGRSSLYLNNLLGAELVQSIIENETISRAKFRKRMIACLPKVFDMIHFMFQSMKHSVTTTEEVIRKITANPFYITDRKEIEEQLTLLKELLPDWISEVVVSSGDTLLRINKMKNTDELQKRLAQAV
ncbi:hypothetical protein MKX01_040317 [Papaver californicum]|nr:hypothetical protein MKX01_040317 [Papaver californicum]